MEFRTFLALRISIFKNGAYEIKMLSFRFVRNFDEGFFYSLARSDLLFLSLNITPKLTRTKYIELIMICMPIECNIYILYQNQRLFCLWFPPHIPLG